MPRKPMHFISVDGEGITYEDSQGVLQHKYVLLSVGDKSLHRHGDRIGFNDIMPFLYRQHQLNPTACFVGFYLSYDFSQWLKDISRDAAWLLLSTEGIAKRTPKRMKNPTPWPVYFAGWEIDILASRRFKLRPAMKDWRTENHYSWMYICDAGSFWQCSLMTAINPKNWTTPILSEAEYEIIKEGKKSRSDATFNDSMVVYNVTENKALSSAMDSLRAGFEEQSWKLTKKQWFGPGQAAEAWLKTINAPRRETLESLIPSDVMAAGIASYYGGWFEIPRHGTVKGTSYEYDINSAYPYIIAGLPCLLHGRWEHSTKDAVNKLSLSGLVLARITTHGSDRYLGGLPHRDRHGIICKPQNVSGWYWAHEINAAIAAGLIDTVQVHETYTYHKCACRPPMYDIARLYEQRLRAGKNTASGKALKLVYNSAYGKFAQSVANPKYGNGLYASLITAGCRTLILEAIATHPKKSAAVLMVATDGVYFSSPHPTLEISPNALGKWDSATKENMTLFMPGVYWDDESRNSLADENTVKIKSRGINGFELAQHIETIDTQFGKRFTEWPAITIPIRFQVTSPKLALARGKWHTCGEVQTGRYVGSEWVGPTRTMSSDPVNKRNGLPVRQNGILTTQPYVDAGTNYGYSKAFGVELQELAIMDEFLTDDGEINREIIEFLNGVD